MWRRDLAGGWLRFDDAAGDWMPSASPPPPPPPPPPPTTFGSLLSTPPPPVVKKPVARGGRKNPLGALSPKARLGAIALAGCLLAGGMGFGALAYMEPEPIDDAVAAGASGQPQAAALPKGKKGRFIAAADAVCAESNAALAAIPTPTTPDGFMAYVHQLGTELKKTRKRLGKLDPPSRDQGVWQKQLGRFDAAIELMNDMVVAVIRQDVQALQKGQLRVTRWSKKVTKWAKRYGFTHCAETS